ncbi:MAG: NADH-quinone oxidoreductase subunit C [Candidatus Marinimicrobia bacterium]|nr:NADH-quinone oxidoreductase subunit C [Candidatus Neomarinimicrobiota bacterium]
MNNSALIYSGLRETADHIIKSLSADVLSAEVVSDELVVGVKRTSIVAVIEFLRDDPKCQFTQLLDICGVDFPEREDRFDVVYHLISMNRNERIRLKVRAGEETPVPSVTSVYACADWFEREVWDMYGVFFSEHPDLRRILTDYGFNGHPQRKDFPLTGYVEMRYDEAQKRVIYEPVKLVQDFRSFDFLSPWEGMQHLLPGDEKASEKSRKKSS